MSTELPHVAICIATHRRPEGLRALLRSLDFLAFDGPAPRITLVIAENAPEQPAFSDASAAAAASRWPVSYLTEPERGIVAARNRCLEGVPGDSTHIAFLDDDETVSQGWLAAMLSTLDRTGAAVVQGPVEPTYCGVPPKWVEHLGVFRLGPFEEGARLNFAATNNSIIALRRLPEVDLRFSPAFNETGGEDEELFGRVRLAGGEVRAASGAVVYDSVPSVRMTGRWVLRRQFRKGNTIARIALQRRSGRKKRVLKGLGALAYGCAIASGPGLLSNTQRMRGLMEAARGAGMLAAFLNVRFREYSPSAVAIDRAGAV